MMYTGSVNWWFLRDFKQFVLKNAYLLLQRELDERINIYIYIV